MNHVLELHEQMCELALLQDKEDIKALKEKVKREREVFESEKEQDRRMAALERRLEALESSTKSSPGPDPTPRAASKDRARALHHQRELLHDMDEYVALREVSYQQHEARIRKHWSCLAKHKERVTNHTLEEHGGDCDEEDGEHAGSATPDNGVGPASLHTLAVAAAHSVPATYDVVGVAMERLSLDGPTKFRERLEAVKSERTDALQTRRALERRRAILQECVGLQQELQAPWPALDGDLAAWIHKSMDAFSVARTRTES